MTKPPTTHPWFLRLAVDVDPAGNPVGRHITRYENGKDVGTVHLAFPDPFDSVHDAWCDLLTTYVDEIGQQLPLF